jgi:hypothetical protein
LDDDGGPEVGGAGGIERRQERRYTLMVPGTIVRSDGTEHRCVTQNASVGGFEIIVGPHFYVGDKISVILQYLDRVDMEVMRLTERGFGGRIVRTALRREVFVSQLRWLIDGQSGINEHPVKGPELRRHARFVPEDRATSVQLMGGRPAPARLIDVSQGGAAVESDLMVTKGRRVLLGKRPSTIVRVFSGGFAVQFDEPLKPGRPKAVDG